MEGWGPSEGSNPTPMVGRQSYTGERDRHHMSEDLIGLPDRT
jgi:hypothetical protein